MLSLEDKNKNKSILFLVGKLMDIWGKWKMYFWYVINIDVSESKDFKKD